jgi:hypothetical protein
MPHLPATYPFNYARLYINGNIRMLINRGRGYKNMRYLLLKAKRWSGTVLPAATRLYSVG